MRDPAMTGYAPIRLPGVTPEDQVLVASRHVPCDGGGDALGHPVIWLRIVAREITCPYCSRSFVLAEDAGEGGHH